MKRNFIRVAKLALVTASALAFMNCDDTSSAPNLDNLGGLSSSSGIETPVIDPETGLPVEQPGAENPGVENPESSSAVVVDPIIDPETGLPVEQPGVDQPSGGDLPGEEIPGDETPDVGGEGSPADGNTDVPVVNPEDPASSSSEVPAVSSSSVEPVQLESSSSEAIQQAPKGIFLAEGGDENKDYLKVSKMEKTGPDGGAILAWPEQLSETQKHGVVVWGPGGGTEPGAYMGIINRLASHGFVVIALSSSPGDASKAIAALDWLEKISQEPGKPLYNKIDFTKVGCSGHSMGGLESEQALIKDKRVIAAMLNNSGDLGHSAMASVSPEKHIGIVYGEGGMERPNAEADYNNAGVKAPACLIKMTGGSGNECSNGECGWGHGSGPWGGMAATVAWMRWHLGGEDSRKADFVGTSGKYINGPIVGERGNWKGQCKNF